MFLSELARHYRTGAPFFELFEMFRKLLLTSVVQFVKPGSATQIVFACLVNFAALCVSFKYSPFPDDAMDALQQVSLTQLFFTTFGALLLFVKPGDGEDSFYFGEISWVVSSSSSIINHQSSSFS